MNDRNQKWKKIENSVSIKMFVIAVLILVLLVPLSSIKSLIRERGVRQEQVINEINTKWGKEMFVYGPILKIPYRHYVKVKKFDKETKEYFEVDKIVIKQAYLFPEELSIDSNVESEILNRSNYESVVYTSSMDFKGVFNPLLLVNKQIDEANVIWDKISLVVQTSNLKGIKEEVVLKLNNNTVPFSAETTISNQGLYCLTSDYTSFLKKTNHLSFEFSLVTNGSQKLEIIPVGKITSFSMKSNWENPSFVGNYLPRTESKKIDENGFQADWKILQANRPFSQVHFDGIPDLKEFSFGTKFIVVANDYQKTERTAKYGLLVIGLTFVVFFIIQLTSKINIHPFQYLMIGFALLMFYTLLISISEHSNYLKAYLTASLLVIILITFYSKWILNSIKFSSFIAGSLFILYGFIYVIIQLETYSLLVGSVGLFMILATIMYVSRNVEFGKITLQNGE